MRENLSWGVCEQQRRRSACACAQTDQRLCYPRFESIISNFATSEISIVYLISVAEQAGLNLALSETLKTVFVATRPISLEILVRIPYTRMECSDEPVQMRCLASAFAARRHKLGI